MSKEADISIWDMAPRYPSSRYRLAMAVINRALRDICRPDNRAGPSHRISAIAFLISRDSAPWFAIANINQDWIRDLLNRSGSMAGKSHMECIERLYALSLLTDYENFMKPADEWDD